MPVQIDDPTIKRTNRAIANARKIATYAKRPLLHEAIQIANDVVIIINEFRQYLKVNLYSPTTASRMTGFKCDTDSLTMVELAEIKLALLMKALTVENRKKMHEEYTQVMRLTHDIKMYIKEQEMTGIPHATS
jgi:hypothetical protein